LRDTELRISCKLSNKEKGIIDSFTSAFSPSLCSTFASALRVGDTLIEVDPRYFRPTEVDFLKADISKAKKKLGWKPRTTFHELVNIMVDYDMKMTGLPPVGAGIKACARKNFTYTNHDFSFYEHIKEKS